MLRMERLGRAREVRMSTANSICTYGAIPCQTLFQVIGTIDLPNDRQDEVLDCTLFCV